MRMFECLSFDGKNIFFHFLKVAIISKLEDYWVGELVNRNITCVWYL